MNKWIGIGRLCADVETRQTQNGKNVATYRLAVDRPASKDGQKEADFLTCVAFGNQADFASKYLHKGMRIAVEGRVQTRNYENKNGQKVYVTEIIIERHEFCESKSSGTAASYNAPQQPVVKNTDDFALVETDDDLPF